MIETIDLGDETQKEIAVVAICQLELNDHLVQNPYRNLSGNSESKLLRKIEPIFDSLKDYSPDVILFPELSLPTTLYPLLISESKRLDSIIVGGSHYEKREFGIVSVCPIIFPNGEIHFSEKLTISPFEKSVDARNEIVSGTVQKVFYNTRCGNFAILICSDFMDDENVAFIKDDDNNLDFIFVIACQSDSNRYYSLMSHYVKNTVNGLYICYSNLKWAKHGEGKSAIFGNVDRTFLTSASVKNLTDLKPMEKIWEAQSPNDYVVAEFDLIHKKPSLTKSVNASPNIRIVGTRVIDTERSQSKIQPNDIFKVAAFDMDGTLLRGIKYSWTSLWEYCGDNGGLWRNYLKQYREDRITYKEWCETAVNYFEKYGLTKSQIIEIARDKCILTEGFYEGIQSLREGGFKIALISGGVDVFLEAIIPDYEQIFDYVYINRLLFDIKGRVSGVKATNHDFDGKAIALEEICDFVGCNLEQSIFVGDRFNDESALKCAGHSIVYSTSDDVVGEESNIKIDKDDFLYLSNYILSLNEIRR